VVGPRCAYDDVYGDWGRLSEIGDSGALLVRPDRHVAWRLTELPDDPATELLTALRQVLSLTSPSGTEHHR
jgi:2,4-dichlorophenol 6-monooxygenase